MVYGYLRVSTDKQNINNQKFEILTFANQLGIKVDEWVEETVSGTVDVKQRKLGQLISKIKPDDILIVSELSRLGRSLLEVMGILNELLKKNTTVYSIKGDYKLTNDLQSQVIAFAFSLAAQVERELISQRTKEALNRRKHEGKKLGRPKGSVSKETKLTGKDEEIKMLLSKGVSVSAIARLMGVNRITVSSYIDKHKILSNQ